MISRNNRELVTVEIRRIGTASLSPTLGLRPAQGSWEKHEAYVYRRPIKSEIRQVNDAGAIFNDEIIVSFQNPEIQILEGEEIRLPDGRLVRVKGSVRRYKRSVQCDCQLLKPQKVPTLGKP